MGNDTTGIYQTLVAAANIAATNLEYQNTFIESIYWDNQPVAATPFNILNVFVPSVDESDVVDIGAGPIQPSNTHQSMYQVPLNKNFSSSFKVAEWEQGLTPFDFQQRFLKPRIESLMRSINNQIVSFFNTTVFANYSIINGAGADSFARVDVSAAWNNLANVGAPLNDNGDMFLTTNSLAYSNMLADANLITQYIVGDAAAISAQQQAHLRMMLGAQVRFDQQFMPLSANKQPGAFYHRYAMAGITRKVSDTKAPPNSAVGTYVQRIKGLPVRFQTWYDPNQQGTMVHMNVWWGVAPARTELCSLLQTA